MAGCTLISGLAVFLLWGFAQQLTLVFPFAIIYGGFVSQLRFHRVLLRPLTMHRVDGGLQLARPGIRKRLCGQQARAVEHHLGVHLLH